MQVGAVPVLILIFVPDLNFMQWPVTGRMDKTRDVRLETQRFLSSEGGGEIEKADHPKSTRPGSSTHAAVST